MPASHPSHKVWSSCSVRHVRNAFLVGEADSMHDLERFLEMTPAERELILPGRDLSTHASKGLDEFNGQQVDVAVTMGCGDECPLVLAGQRVDWKIPDPRDMTPEEFRGVRDLIEQKVTHLLVALEGDHDGHPGTDPTA